MPKLNPAQIPEAKLDTAAGHLDAALNRDQKRGAFDKPGTVVYAIVARDRRALPGMNPTECRLVALHLTRLGLPASEIGRILSRAPRTVYRWRAQARTAA